jgi:hypothetical protein
MSLSKESREDCPEWNLRVPGKLGQKLLSQILNDYNSSP